MSPEPFSGRARFLAPLLLGLLFQLPFFAGCGIGGTSSQDAAKFNDRLVKQFARITETSKGFGLAVRKAIDKSGNYQETARGSLEKIKNEVSTFWKENATIKVPNSDSAKRFFELHQELLKDTLDIMEKDFSRIVKIAEDPYGSVEEKNRKLAEAFSKMRDQKDLIRRVIEAQKKFASDNSLKLQ